MFNTRERVSFLTPVASRRPAIDGLRHARRRVLGSALARIVKVARVLTGRACVRERVSVSSAIHWQSALSEAGLASRSRTASRHLGMVSAGLHFSFRMSRQMAPPSGTLQW